MFSRLPRDDKNLAVVVEAKALHEAVLGAFGQAKDYAKKYQNCERIILTDGLRYGVYLRDGGEWAENPLPYAYFNVRRLRNSYPVYGNEDDGMRGAKEAIYAMTPFWTP